MSSFFHLCSHPFKQALSSWSMALSCDWFPATVLGLQGSRCRASAGWISWIEGKTAVGAPPFLSFCLIHSSSLCCWTWWGDQKVIVLDLFTYFIFVIYSYILYFVFYSLIFILFFLNFSTCDKWYYLKNFKGVNHNSIYNYESILRVKGLCTVNINFKVHLQGYMFDQEIHWTLFRRVIFT